jgi:hypothetical protein
MRRLLKFLLLLTVCGCGERTGSDTDPDPDLSQGVIGDPWHCGESDAKCVGPLDIGECIDGECQGRLFDCWTSGASCSEICAADPGSTCAEGRCDGATAFGWSATSSDEAVEMCASANEATAMPLTISCDDPLPLAEYPGIRCCCLW